MRMSATNGDGTAVSSSPSAAVPGTLINGTSGPPLIGSKGDGGGGGASDDNRSKEIDPMSRRPESVADGRVAKEVVVSGEASIRTESDTQQLMNDEHNKDHVAAADEDASLDRQTPSDEHNNKCYQSSVGGAGVGDKDADKRPVERDSLEGSGRVSTYPNNGNVEGEKEKEEDKKGTKNNNTTITTSETTRRRLLAEDIVPQPSDAGATEMESNDKAVQCNSLTDPAAIQLQDWKEMPRYLQFNPYVLTGYRPLQNVSGCFGSLFYVHNETFNILTHGECGWRGGGS